MENLSKDIEVFMTGQRPECLFLEALDASFGDEGKEHFKALEQSVSPPFAYACFYVRQWNDELSPYPAGPIFGKEGFGGEGKNTFGFLEKELLPYLRGRFGDIPIYLGGYSLAALFACYCATQSTSFSGIAAASPSIWYDGYLNFALAHPVFVPKVSLSLGDKEHLAKNKVLSRVKEHLLRYEEILKSQGVSVVLTWNKGNHFADVARRVALAFAALI